MPLTNEQRAHDIALKYAELKFLQQDDLARKSGQVTELGFLDTYLEAYNNAMEKLQS